MVRRERKSAVGDDGATNVWLQPQVTRRDPLTRERIVEVALGVLDADGAAALTMRRLAEGLGVGPATLYGHVRTKEDVLDLALDGIYDEVPLPEEGRDWRADLSALLHAWRNVLLRHPWSSTVLSRPQLGPCKLAREERLYALLATSGLRGSEVQDTAYALSNYVIGSVLMQVAWQEQDDRTRHGAARHIASQRDLYPALAAHRDVADADWDRSFGSGLETLLNGIAPRQSLPPT